MEMSKVVRWLHTGPRGVPAADCFPVLALLSRRLSDDEVKEVAREVIRRGDFDVAEIGVLVTRCLDELPTPDDIRRVQRQLAVWELGAD
jgi:hypothetical protein